jgi:serine/threonine protein kinase/pectin methylesterase-like acyl-CoA thioesterase
MSDSADCPSPDQLHRALSGELPPDRIVAIEQHLLECGPCAQQTLHSGDLQTYSQALRQSSQTGEAAVSKADAEQLVQLIERLRELPHQPQATQFFGGKEGSRNADLESELVSYLQPARAAEELGWLGTYRVLKLLGAGGMGGVFLAEDTQLHRRVALKVMRPDISGHANADERFLREARAAAAMHHDHIVTIFQVGRDGQVPFLAMEFLEGETLEDRLRRDRVMPLSEVLRIGREIAEGLAAAHSRGLVHRDIKPANIWLESRASIMDSGAHNEQPPRVKLLDFGLARAADANFELTSQGMVIGTPAYMAPEQAAGDMVGHKADLFSFGVVLYRLATGVLPFQGKDAISTLIAIKSESPDDPRLRRPDLPEELSDLILQLLKKNPDERSASAVDVAKQLARIALSMPASEIPSNTPTIAYRSEQPAKRSIWRIVAAFLLLTLLGGIVVIATDRGQVEVVIDSKDDDVDVQVVVTRSDGYFQVFDKKTGSKVKGFWSGKYEVEVKDDTNSFQANKTGFVLKRGETEILTVTRRPVSEIPSNVESTKRPADLAQRAPESEPPPLSEWLQGRKILTVAQDGSGQFKTIQAALDALQSGQVVKVLDRGPYTESLRCTVPRDTGLISDVQTVLEAADWPAETHPHEIQVIEGFRLNGLRVQARPRDGWFEVLHVITPSSLVVENCSFGLSVPDPDRRTNCSGLQLSFDQHRRALQPVWIRACLLEKNVGADGPLANGTIVVENNLFQDSAVAMDNCDLHTLVVRHNVFENPKLDPMWFNNVSSVKETLEVVNNTASMPSDSRSTGIPFLKVLPPSNVIIRNNLSDSNVVMNDQLWNRKPNSFELWQVDHNGYSREIRPYMRATTDVVGKFTFLSTDTTNADAWRIPGDSPLATGGAGGSLPGYIGALPPGPAPKDGDWFTRLRERWSTENIKRSETSSPAEIPEPPPLAEWLKGRKILTVAQDGSGQFKTIQAALDALQPGETVKVLDRGPYRESLLALALPPDSGLITEVQTILEVSEWKLDYQVDSATGGKVDLYRGHSLNGADGFRFHGFEMRFPPSNGKRVGRCGGGRTKGFVLENCFIHASESFDGESIAFSDWHEGNGVGMSLWMRDCVLEGSVALVPSHKAHPLAPDRLSTVVVERNYFLGVGTQHHLMILGESLEKVIIRQNVFAGKSGVDINLSLFDASDSLEVSNNLLLSKTGILFQERAPRGAVTIRNNLHTQDAIVGFSAGIKLRETARSWNMDHNAYPDLRAGAAPEHLLPRPPVDLTALPRFLSKVPQETDYLRIPADDALATAGAGGAWPKHLGPLPPGPSPKGGDWFTRLRERSLGIQTGMQNQSPSTGPTPIPEVPALAEWLKGREVITVAQDGSGQHKTITSAMKEIKAGQVVKVLDAGTYREHLLLRDLPSDVGLISDRQATLETDDWSIGDAAQDIGGFDGFRFSGFRVIAPWAKDFKTVTHWLNPSGLVIEDCYFGRSGGGSSSNELAVHLKFTADIVETKPVVIRNCVFDGGQVGVPTQEFSHNTIVISENLFRRGQIYFEPKEVGRVVLRNNVFEMADKCGIHFAAIETVHESFEISNNTIVKPPSARDAQPGVVVLDAIPSDKFIICNNLMNYGIALPEPRAGARSTPVDSSKVGHNAYISKWPREFKAASNIRLVPDYLSWDSKHRDAWRVANDGPLATGGAGGNWPGYIGALPPGPAPAAGDWFTRLRERWPFQDVAPTSSPITSPLPLADWLQGREVLTVAQDGKGQFKSIREALVALKPHQVVRVLDRGPYRELLRLRSVADDAGLVTDQQTVLEINLAESPEAKDGHLIAASKNFRFSGFQVLAPADKRGFDWIQSSGLVIEDCYFGKMKSTNPERAFPLGFSFNNVDLDAEPIHIRRCVFEMMGLDFRGKVPSFVVEQNYFKDAAVTLEGPTFKRFIARNNVFDTGVGAFWFVNLQDVSNGMELANNTIRSTQSVSIVYFNKAAPQQGVTIRNNLAAGGVQLTEVTDEVLASAKQRWRVSRNGYTDVGSLPPTSDVTAFIEYLSTDVTSRDYLRLPLSSPLAKRVPNEAQANFIGALPAGPAPVDGDWFTRLRERWPLNDETAKGNDQPSAPAIIPRVASLAEWLKDRAVVTVAQDGSGQHRTITAAIRALRPYQVIKVLDRGPYKEHLRFAGMPIDTGLISEKQTIIEVDDWKGMHTAHEMGPLSAFRLSGFCFIAPQSSEWRIITAWIQPSGLVIEDCYFGRRSVKGEKPGPEASIQLGFNSGGVGVFPALVRNCVFDGGSIAILAQKDPHPTIAVTHNFFRRAFVGMHSEVGTVVIQHNLFESSGASMLWSEKLTKVHNILEISNNTVGYTAPLEKNSGMVFVDDGPEDKVVIRNNITDSGVCCGAPDEKRKVMNKKWLMDHNAYIRRWACFEGSPTDILDDPNYLSTEPNNRNAWRIAPGSPLAKGGAGGSWPTYIGAFPPGPAPADGDWFTRIREKWQSVLDTNK